MPSGVPPAPLTTGGESDALSIDRGLGAAGHRGCAGAAGNGFCERCIVSGVGCVAAVLRGDLVLAYDQRGQSDLGRAAAQRDGAVHRAAFGKHNRARGSGAVRIGDCGGHCHRLAVRRGIQRGRKRDRTDCLAHVLLHQSKTGDEAGVAGVVGLDGVLAHGEGRGADSGLATAHVCRAQGRAVGKELHGSGRFAAELRSDGCREGDALSEF